MYDKSIIYTEKTMKLLVVLSLSILCCNASTTRQQRSFPDDFIFGTATASYQIEGAWNEDDKGENIWDRMTHTRPEVIKDQSNGDVAADSYHNYKRDVEMMRELGLDAYRFSFSWARLLPTGFPNKISEAGLAFYNNYINEMLKYNIQPMATMYHWDLPQKLQDLGGFANPHFVDWFEDYARVLYENFGDRIKLWITFNEPRQICEQGYGDVVKAPILNATGIGEYICAKHLTLAHARAYHAYVNDYKDTQGGVCGITINVSAFEPDTDTDEDRFAAELKKQADWGLYAEPIFSEEGGFPKDLSEKVSMKSAAQGYPKSRLPEFTEEEKAYIRGTSDFFGINHYTANLVSASSYKTEHAVPSIGDDIDVGYYQPSEWPKGASSWMYLAPNSLYKAIMDLKERYNNPDIYVTENGWSTTGGLDDDDRVAYYRAALEDVLDAIEDGVNLKGYMAWSLLDNYEWMQGYTERFGLYEVDFESPMRTRTPRKSAFVYKQIIKTRVIDHQYEPETMTMTIDEGH